jgi:hypothetical protein
MTRTLTATKSTLDHIRKQPDDERCEFLTRALGEVAREARVVLESALDTQRALLSLANPPRGPRRRSSGRSSIKPTPMTGEKDR